MKNKLYAKFETKAWAVHNSPRCFQSNDDVVEISNIYCTYRIYADGRMEQRFNDRNKITAEVNGKNGDDNQH